MGVGAGIFLIAVGAILTYAVNADLEGIELDTIGVILMIAGLAVALFSMFFYAVNRSGTRRGRIVEERYTNDPLDHPL